VTEPTCPAIAAGEFWYRDAEVLAAELAIHGSQAVAGRAHKASQAVVTKWCGRLGVVPTGSHTSVEPGEPVDELEILRQRNRDLEKHARNLRQVDVAEERMLLRLEEAVTTAKPRYKPRALTKKALGKEPHEFALLFSDTHASEVVRSSETLGMNEYGWEIMLARMARLQEAVLTFADHRPYPISKLHVWMLGDMLSGDIHDELAQTNDRPGAEAAVQFGYDAAAWLEEFVPHFGKVSVVGVPGNHPRHSRKPAAKQAHNNADWTAYQVMRLYHRDNPAFEWNVPSAAFATTTAAERWRVLLMHGDGIRSTMPGVPWGGVVRRITTLEQQFAKSKQPLDYVCLGHFHTANTLDGVGVKTFLNGSVKGLDEWSLKMFGSGRHASQLLLTFHPGHGVTDVSLIDLQDNEPASER
jgi:hypothetical protein